MRKRSISPTLADSSAPEGNWLDLEALAIVEVSSEDADYPVEGALLAGQTRGWRASEPGEQTLRICFDSPQRLQRIWLRIDETDSERAQEFVLRWSADGRAFHEIVRQQWHFSPGGSTTEVEDYQVDLNGVTVLELVIIADRSGGPGRASLTALRMAND